MDTTAVGGRGLPSFAEAAASCVEYHGGPLELNVSLAMQCVDACSTSRDNTKYLLTLAAEKLRQGTDPEGMYRALELVEICVKNNGIDFARHMDDYFLRSMAKVLKIKLKRKVLFMLQLWHDSFVMQQERCPAIFAMYRKLRSKGHRRLLIGVEFPRIDQSQKFLVKNAEDSPAFVAVAARPTAPRPPPSEQAAAISEPIEQQVSRIRRCLSTCSSPGAPLSLRQEAFRQLEASRGPLREWLRSLSETDEDIERNLPSLSAGLDLADAVDRQLALGQPTAEQEAPGGQVGGPRRGAPTQRAADESRAKGDSKGGPISLLDLALNEPPKGNPTTAAVAAGAAASSDLLTLEGSQALLLPPPPSARPAATTAAAAGGSRPASADRGAALDDCWGSLSSVSSLDGRRPGGPSPVSSATDHSPIALPSPPLPTSSSSSSSSVGFAHPHPAFGATSGVPAASALRPPEPIDPWAALASPTASQGDFRLGGPPAGVSTDAHSTAKPPFGAPPSWSSSREGSGGPAWPASQSFSFGDFVAASPKGRGPSHPQGPSGCLPHNATTANWHSANPLGGQLALAGPQNTSRASDDPFADCEPPLWPQQEQQQKQQQQQQKQQQHHQQQGTTNLQPAVDRAEGAPPGQEGRGPLGLPISHSPMAAIPVQGTAGGGEQTGKRAEGQATLSGASLVSNGLSLSHPSKPGAAGAPPERVPQAGPREEKEGPREEPRWPGSSGSGHSARAQETTQHQQEQQQQQQQQQRPQQQWPEDSWNSTHSSDTLAVGGRRSFFEMPADGVPPHPRQLKQQAAEAPGVGDSSHGDSWNSAQTVAPPPKTRHEEQPCEGPSGKEAPQTPVGAPLGGAPLEAPPPHVSLVGAPQGPPDKDLLEEVHQQLDELTFGLNLSDF
ncbi:hypothetical protein Emag_001472 [Eimeria magna]